MASLNQVFLMGNVTRDPQTRAGANNQNVVNFGLAVNRHFKDADGNDREDTCFVDCAAFGRQADVLAKYLRKGTPLLVQGRLKFDAWDDPAGARRTRHSVVVEHFQFLGGRDGFGNGSGADAFQTSAGGRESNRPADATKFDQSEIPF